MTRFDRLEHRIVRLSIGLALLGGAGLIIATVITCVSILLKVGRRAIDAAYGANAAPSALEWVTPILGEEELVQFAVGAALFAALPYVMLRRGHIRVDLLQPLFGDRLNRLLDLLGDVAIAVIAYLIMTRQWFLIFKKPRGDNPLWIELLITGEWPEIMDRLRDSQETQIIGIKLWPSYVVAEICVAAFFCVAIFCVAKSVRALLGLSHHD